jgi:hypothetical protein
MQRRKIDFKTSVYPKFVLLVIFLLAGHYLFTVPKLSAAPRMSVTPKLSATQRLHMSEIYRFNPRRNLLGESFSFRVGKPRDLIFDKNVLNLKGDLLAHLRKYSVEDIDSTPKTIHLLTMNDIERLVKTDMMVHTEVGVITADEYLDNNIRAIENMIKNGKPGILTAMWNYDKDDAAIRITEMRAKEEEFDEMKRTMESKMVIYESKITANERDIKSFERELQTYRWIVFSLAGLFAGLFGLDTAIKIMRQRK